MFCGNCGQKIEEGAAFCGGCGAPVAEAQQPTVHTQKVHQPTVHTQEVQQPTTHMQEVQQSTTHMQEVQQPTMHTQEVPAWQQSDAAQNFAEEKQLLQEKMPNDAPVKKRSKLYAILILLGIAIVAAAIVVTVWYFVLHKTPSSETSDDNLSQAEDMDATGDTDGIEDKEEVQEDAASQESEIVIEEVAPIVDKIEIDAINQIITTSGVSGTFSVTVLDLDSNRVYATSNGDTAYSASALINIPILFTIADGLKNNTLTLNDMAYFSYTFDGRGVLKKEQNGSRISVGQLMNDMLQYSDNNATNSLINYLGMSKINQTCNQNGFSSVRIERVLTTDTTTKDNYISTNDLVNMMSLLYSDAYPIGTEYLKNYFVIGDSIGRNGLGKYVPTSCVFLNHNGITADKYNEIAVVETATSKYVVAVLANSGQADALTPVVANIGQYVYEQFA